MKNMRSGFTLVEIMIVVAIVGILATLGSLWIGKAMNNSRIKRAESELHLLGSAILQMAWDTGKWPNGASRSEDVASENEVMNLSAGALFSNQSGDFPNWKGPYFQGSLEDPWGKPYFFDSDYRVDGVNRIVIGSGGPNKSGLNRYDDDNVWVALDNLSPQSSEE